MECVGFAKLAILFQLYPVRNILFVFCAIVVALLAFRAGQCNSYPHIATSLAAAF